MAGNEIKSEMMRGHIDTFILLSLVDSDKDSNEIKTSIEEKSENKLTVKQGTFYSAMQRLVKQNFIKEYRSSAVDGIRRKYYSLTEKGKKSLEKNREEWNKSKELIDNIIDSPSEPEKSQPQFTKIEFDEFDEFKKLADTNAKDYNFETPEDDDGYLDRIGEEVLNDLNDELNAINEENESDTEKTYDIDVDTDNENATSFYDDILPPDDSELLTDASDEIPHISDNNEYAGDNETHEDSLPVLSDEDATPDEDTIVYDFELPQEDEENAPDELTSDDEEQITSEITDTENIEKSQINSEENCSTEKSGSETDKEENENSDEEPGDEIADKTEEKPNEPYSQHNDLTLENEPNGKDDSLYVEDGKPTNRREYKSILGKLFPKQEEENETKSQSEIKTISAKQIDFDEYSEQSLDDEKKYEDYDENSEIESKNFSSDENNAFNEERSFESRAVKQEQNNRINQQKSASKAMEKDSNQSSDYDFSDLYKMAKHEGFKVRTSLSTNKFNGNGIFLNKLNFHASLLFYVLLFAEMLILNFALSGILKWSFAVKAIIAGVPAALPLIMLAMYVVSPRRKVREISQFRDAITVFLIVTFQLIIIDLCVALFVEVDFNNIKEVLTYIVVPFILIINIPLFAIVKYSLLDTGRYFDEGDNN